MSAYDKVIGYEMIKEKLKNYGDCLANPEKYKKLGVRIPKGVILDGMPGLGKTLMANCFIEESNRKSYVIRRKASDEEFISEMRNTFEEAAKNAPSIILLDDMDKFANEDEFHKDAKEYVAIQSLIDDYSSTDIFLIATTNYMNGFPDSLIRPGRFDSRIFFNYPDDDESVKIITYYLENKELDEDVDIELIARLMSNNSCAAIEQAINEAGLYAGYRNKEKVDNKSLLCACLKHEFRDDCLVMEEVNEKNWSDMRNTAVHEIGHTIIAEVLEAGSVNLVAILKGDSREVKGFTNMKPVQPIYVQKNRVRNILISLGGKAAAEVVLGDVDTGCIKDIDGARYDVDRLVGANSQYGFYTGRDKDKEPWYDKNRCELVAKELERYYLIAKRIISKNRELYDALESELEKNKILTFRDIDRIKKEVGKELVLPEWYN